MRVQRNAQVLMTFDEYEYESHIHTKFDLYYSTQESLLHYSSTVVLCKSETH